MMTEEELASEVRVHLSSRGVIREIKMFGGLGFMLNGNMVAAVSKRGLLLRIGKDSQSKALARPEARPMEMRGRRMEGYVYVDPLMLKKGALQNWLDEASSFVRQLPPKPASGKSQRKGKRA
jgi:TfoX/Sxy family transcriptional regulator of competence genes